MENTNGEIRKGFKYGCGGAIGVIAALIAIPLLLLAGCLFLGTGSYIASENAKMEALGGELVELRSCARHDSVFLEATTGYAHLEDAVKAASGQKIDGETFWIERGTHAKVLGNGKENQRRVELDSGARWWISGDTECERD